MVTGGAVPAAAPVWKGKVKSVPSGDTVVIMDTSKAEEVIPPPEMSVTLSCIIAPSLVRSLIDRSPRRVFHQSYIYLYV
jgi:hypothetical protein